MPTQVMSEPKQAKAGRKSISMLVVSSVALAMLLSAALAGFRFHFTYFDLDTISYFFQAKLFAQGRLAAEAPPDLGFSALHSHQRRPIALVFEIPLWKLAGAFAGSSGGCALVDSGPGYRGRLLLLYGILLETYRSKVARVGIVLGVISPPTIVLGSVWFSEAVSRFCVGLFLYLLILAFKNQDWKRAAFAGMALGYAFDTETAHGHHHRICNGTTIRAAFLGGYVVDATGAASCVPQVWVSRSSAGLTVAWNFRNDRRPASGHVQRNAALRSVGIWSPRKSVPPRSASTGLPAASGGAEDREKLAGDAAKRAGSRIL
jgi:hypothetical protein